MTQTPAGDVTVVAAGAFIDGTGAPPRRRVFIEINGDRITALRDDVPPGTKAVDAEHLTILPGLIDCHVHLWARAGAIEERLMKPYSLIVSEALLHARDTLDAGITTVRDAGGTPRGMRDAIKRGLHPGPRILIAVGALSQTGGHGDSTMPGGLRLRVDDAEHPDGIADGIDGVRRATRLMIRAGADHIKVMASGGVFSPNDEPHHPGYSLAELRTIVAEAAAFSRHVMAHAISTDGISNAVEAGVRSIEHGVYLDEETAKEMARRGTYLVPTLTAPQWAQRRSGEPGAVPAYAQRKIAPLLEAHRASVALAISCGVRIAMGTDSGVGPHGSNAGELRLLVDAGLSPMAAIVAATKTASECLQMDQDIGTLAVGKKADLIGVARDPLADIAVLSAPNRMALVMKDGRVHRTSLDWQSG